MIFLKLIWIFTCLLIVTCMIGAFTYKYKKIQKILHIIIPFLLSGLVISGLIYLSKGILY